MMQGVARPCGRGGHSMAMLQATSGKLAMLVHGGRTKDDKLCKDTWLLELQA